MTQLNLPSDKNLTIFSGYWREFPRDAIIILLVSIAVYLKFLSKVSIKALMSFSSFDVLFHMVWSLLMTSNQKVSLSNPEYLEICCHISCFCLKGCYNLKYVFVTPWRKTPITTKTEILHNVIAFKFDLQLI